VADGAQAVLGGDAMCKRWDLNVKKYQMIAQMQGNGLFYRLCPYPGIGKNG
jgi:hypothetical protein